MDNAKAQRMVDGLEHDTLLVLKMLRILEDAYLEANNMKTVARYADDWITYAAREQQVLDIIRRVSAIL